mgnify:CR=1 FL=1
MWPKAELGRFPRPLASSGGEQEPPAPPKQPDSDDEPNPAQGLEYQLTGQGLGMVELGPDGVVGCADSAMHWQRSRRRISSGCISSRWLLLRVWE